MLFLFWWVVLLLSTAKDDKLTIVLTLASSNAATRAEGVGVWGYNNLSPKKLSPLFALSEQWWYKGWRWGVGVLKSTAVGELVPEAVLYITRTWCGRWGYIYSLIISNTKLDWEVGCIRLTHWHDLLFEVWFSENSPRWRIILCFHQTPPASDDKVVSDRRCFEPYY